MGLEGCLCWLGTQGSKESRDIQVHCGHVCHLQWLLIWGLPLTNGLAPSSLGPHPGQQ